MKPLFKLIVSWVCRVLIWVPVGIIKLGELFLRTDQPFQMGAQWMSMIPGVAGNYCRKEFYRLTLCRCGPDVCIEFGTILNQPTIELGRRVYIGLYCTVGECVIDDDVMIGSNVDIISGKNQHDFSRLDVPIREQGGRLEKIIIGADSWVGNSSVIMANIGSKGIVGAGAVVVHNVEAYAIVAGNPARVLGSRKGFAD